MDAWVAGARTAEIDEADAGGRRHGARRRRADRGRGGDEAGRRADGRAPHRPDPDASSTRSTASTARAARGRTPTPSTGTPPSSARTAPRRSPRRPPATGSGRSSSPRTRSTTCGERTDYWLGQQGRITEPMVLRRGRHPLRADRVGRRVRADRRPAARPRLARTRRSSTPRARPPTRRRSSTSCSSAPSAPTTCPTAPTCATSRPAVALAEAIGIGKGSVSLEDIHRAELIVVVGQNPGTNHPRMLTALEKAKRNGARIIAINPLQEAGLVRFKNPQKPRGLVGTGTGLADLHLPVRVNGDLALFQAIGSLLVEWDAVDHDFVERHTTGSRSGRRTCATLDWDAVRRVDRARPRPDRARPPRCSATPPPPSPAGRWGSPSTATRSPRSRRSSTSRCSRATSASPAPGCARCAATPTSRATARWASGSGCPTALPRRAARRVRLRAAARARLRHRRGDRGRCATATAQVFIGMGGNFVSAAPDTEVTEEAMRNADLTVHVSTKLNRSHVVHRPRGADPARRSAAARRTCTGGREQRVTVEDSMSAVHASHGPLEAGLAAPAVRGRHRLLARAGDARRPSTRSRGPTFRDDYTEIRHRIARVVPGCAAYDEKVDQPGGFVLPHPPRDTRTFPTEAGKAVFTVSPTDVLRGARGPAAAADAALARPVQHHDLRPRRPLPRGQGRPAGRLRAPRRHRRTSGFADGDVVDMVSEWTDGSSGPAPDVPGRVLRPAARLRRRLLPRDQRAGPARLHGRAAATARRRSRSIVRLERAGGGSGVSDPSDAGQGHRRRAHGDAPSARSNRSSPDDQPRARPRRGRLRTGAGDVGGDHDAARGAAGRAAGDDRTPHAAAAAALADRRLVLRRPLRPRRRWTTPAGCASRRTRTPGCRP